MQILIRINYGYYVIERILQKCTDETLRRAVSGEVIKNFKHIGTHNLKKKWSDLL